MSISKTFLITIRKYFALAVLLLFCQQELTGQSFPVKHFSEQDGLPGMTIYSLLEDNEGLLWLATNHGLCRYNGQSFDRIDSPEIEGYEILTLSVDSKNRIWFSSFLGQICFFSNGKVTPFKHEELPDDISILDLYIDSKDNIWLGTRKNIFQFKAPAENDEFELVRQTPNKPGASYFNFTEDDSQRVWATAYQGNGANTIIYRPHAESEESFDLPISNPGLIYATNSGRLFVFQAFPNTVFYEMKGNDDHQVIPLKDPSNDQYQITKACTSYQICNDNVALYIIFYIERI